jgi:hypothetical protein
MNCSKCAIYHDIDNLFMNTCIHHICIKCLYQCINDSNNLYFSKCPLSFCGQPIPQEKIYSFIIEKTVKCNSCDYIGIPSKDGILNCEKCNVPACIRCEIDHIGFSCVDYLRINQLIPLQRDKYIELTSELGIEIITCPSCKYLLDNPHSKNILSCFKCNIKICWTCNNDNTNCSCQIDSIDWTIDDINYNNLSEEFEYSSNN